MSDFASPNEREAQIMQYKEETSRRIADMLKPGVSIHEIARLLGAEDLVTVEETSRHREPVYRFDVQAFIKRAIDEGTFLRLPDVFAKLEKVILPPDEGEILRTGSNKGLEKKKLILRSRYLVELLTELNEPYQVVCGTNSKDMKRGESYIIFVVPNLEKVIFVNNEEGNATFIIHRATGVKDWQQFSKMTKDELKDLGTDKVTPIAYHGDSEKWKKEVELSMTSSPVFTNVEPKNKSDIKEETIPTDWLVMHQLAMLVTGASENTVKAYLIDVLAVDNPDDVKTRGKQTWFSPKILAMAKEHFATRRPAPDGWLTWRAISSLIDRDPATVKKIIKLILTQHPDWKPEVFNDAGGHPAAHYSPAFITEAKKYTIPKDFISIPELHSIIGRRYGTIVSAIKRLSTEPDPIKTIGSRVSYCSKDLGQRVIEHFKARKKAPADWLNEHTIAKSFPQFSPTFVTKELRKLVTSAPEFRPESYEDAVGVVNPHYPKEVITALKQRFKIQ